MTNVLISVVAWLNVVANVLGGILLAPVAIMPGWLSATIIAAVTGIVMLVLFKYTSNQHAIKAVRDDIKAQLFALKLFKDNPSVIFRAQGRLFAGAFWLLVYALVPVIVMTLPVLLILGQMALWYQFRPLQKGEETVMTLTLNGEPEASWPEVKLEPTSAIEVETGPVRALKSRFVCWRIKALEPGYHKLVFSVGGQRIEKDLAIGDDLMRVSVQRPAWSLWDVLENPWEPPFTTDSAVRSIEIEYPQRTYSWWDLSWSYATDMWILYWFVVSMIAAFCFKSALKVNI